jgi:hypothetical protein
MSKVLTIVDHIENENLRQVSWSQLFLDKIKRRYKLKHGEAVLFINKAKDRIRLVVNFYNLAVLVLPPTDREERLSLYLKVNEFLKRLSGEKSYTFIETEIELCRERIERRRKLLTNIRRKHEKSNIHKRESRASQEIMV